MGYVALIFFFGTTVLASATGIVLVSLIGPGRVQVAGDLPPAVVQENAGVLANLLQVLRSMVPENIVTAAGDFNILGLLLCSIVVGVVLTTLKEQRERETVLYFFLGCNTIIMKIVKVVMWYAPIGIASIIAARLGGDKDFLDTLFRLFLYVVTVLLGLFIHGVVTLPLIFTLVRRELPFRFLRGLAQALVTAFGTDSSSATLPTTMRCVEAYGVPTMTSRFVTTLGSTVNMNGTALYEAVAAVYIAQLSGVSLTITQLILVCLTATIAAAGAAGIPEAGLVTLVMVVEIVGLPPESIGYILAVDWFLDRCRTVMNVEGDAIGAAIVDHFVSPRVSEEVEEGSHEIEMEDIPPAQLGGGSGDDH